MNDKAGAGRMRWRIGRADLDEDERGDEQDGHDKDNDINLWRTTKSAVRTTRWKEQSRRAHGVRRDERGFKWIEKLL